MTDEEPMSSSVEDAPVHPEPGPAATVKPDGPSSPSRNADPNPSDAQGGASSSLHYSLLGPSLLKAGQNGVDQSKVASIIYDASKGSKFFAHEQERDAVLTQRISDIVAAKKELERGNQKPETMRVDETIAQLEAGRDLSQYIVHVDCDAFYASVEELDRPELKKVPMAVGGGVLCTCNYMARKSGVRSGMAGHIAKKICPELVFIPLNFGKYQNKAEEVRSVLVKYDPRFEAIGCDEAFLNITKYLDEHPEYTPESLVQHMREQVHELCKITVSAGIGANAKLAKIASNINKPNGQFRIPNDRASIMSFMSTLSVRSIIGIGRVFERELQSIGISTCGDIYPQRAFLRPLFGDKALSFLLNCYLGLGRTEVRPIEEYARKSVGTESTFRDLSGPGPLREKLRFTAGELEKDLKRTGERGKTLVLKIKLHTYQVLTRQRPLNIPVCKAEELYNLALPLLRELEKEHKSLKIRLMGLRVANLIPKKEAIDMQKWFFGSNPPPQQRQRQQQQQQQPAQPKIQTDADGWQIWPEEEFELQQKEEEEEELQATQELNEELEGREGEEEGEPGAAAEAEMWTCPVCERPQPADDTAFNQHVDFCLSKQAIREAVSSSKPQEPVAKKRVMLAPHDAGAGEKKRKKTPGRR